MSVPSVGEDPVAEVLETSAAGPAAIRGSALRAAGYGAGLALALASAPLLFRHLGVVEFGRYAAVLSVVTLAAGFSEGGLNAIALREWSTAPPAERRRLMASLLGIRIALTAVAVAAAVAFSFAAGYGSALVAGTALAGAGLLGQSLQTLLSSPLQAELRFGWATLAELLRQIVLAACLVGLVLAGAGVVPLLAAQIPAGLAGLALTVVLVRGDVPLRPRVDRRTWGALLSDTVPFGLAVAINAAYFRIALLVMSVAATELQTGYFATSFRIVEVLIAIPPVVLAAAFPILSRAASADADRFAYATGRLFEVALLAGGLAVVAMELGAEVAVDVLAGAGYEEAVPILRIQSVAVLATFATVACAYPLLSLRRHREILAANLLALAASGVALAILVGPFEAVGAAIATLVAEITLTIAVAVALRRAHARVRLSPVAFVWVVVATIAGIGAGLLSGLPDLAQVALGSAVYCAVVAVAHQVPAELLQAVRR